jgi:NADPH-dependent 2,4-dienoyl-CoA reductase/sulfur reductase-like enzyme
MREVKADVAVVGAGPAGIAAACEAAERGKRVMVLDENPASGGQIWRRGSKPAPPAAQAWLDRLAASGAVIHAATSVVDVDGPTAFFARDPDGILRLGAERVVLATGARELFLPFPGWTLPGVMGAGGIQALVKGGWPVKGRRIIVAGSGPLLLAVAHFLRASGAEIVALVEQARRLDLIRTAPTLLRYPSKFRQGLGFANSLRGVPKLHSSWPLRAEGDTSIRALVVRTPGGERRFKCDLVGCGFGLVPEARLARIMGAALDGDVVRVDARQQTSLPGVFAAGELTGIGGVDAALAEGRVAGCAAAGAAFAADDLSPARDRERSFGVVMRRAFRLRDDLRALAEPDTTVCRCEDVTWSEVEAFDDARAAKLQTRCAMGPCQGRVCGPALRFIRGWGPDRVRPPLLPIPTAALAEISAAHTPEVTQ